MRLFVIITFWAIASSLQAQHIDSILVRLNEPIQKNIDNTIAEMFGDQDTIFTETDSFMMYTTPDMIWDEMDTVEYRYNKASDSYREWNYNGDELAEAMAVVYLADKRTGKPLDNEANQYFVLTTALDEDEFEISYFEDIMACHVCGMEGAEPDISILIKENRIELIEVKGVDDYILNDEFKLLFEDGALLVEEHISAVYHNPTENLFSTALDRTTMMELETFEPSNGEEQTFRLAIMPAEMARRITIDGNLDEKEWNRDYKINWRPVHSTIVGEKHTMTDLFAKYSVTWDEENLYVGLKVKDDKLVPMDLSSGKLLGDHIKIDLDFGKFRARKGNLVQGMRGRAVGLVLGFDKLGVAAVYDAEEGESIEDIEVAFLRNKAAGGYEAEIRIPLSSLKPRLRKTLQKLSFNIGQSINFTISVADADNMETKEIKHIDASSKMDEVAPFKMGKIEFFKNYRMRTLEEIKK